MHHSTHGNSDGHHWYADFIILCFLMTHFKDLSQAHTTVYLKKYNSKIPTFTPSLLNQNIESLNTICRLQENKMLQKTATTGRQPVVTVIPRKMNLKTILPQTQVHMSCYSAYTTSSFLFMIHLVNTL